MKELMEELESIVGNIEEAKEPTGETLYKALKKIVDDESAEKIGGSLVDLTTASMLVKVADALKSKNRKNFLSLPVTKMATFGWKLTKK